MKPNGVTNVVLPAAEIVADHQPTDMLLSTLGTNTKEVIQMFLDAWCEQKHFDDHMWSPAGQGETMACMHRLSARLLVMDILFSAMEQRYEVGALVKLTEEDRKAAETVMMSIWDSLTDTIFPLTQELGMSDLQVSQLRFVRWLGDDFIISIPYRQTALADEGRTRDQENLRYAPRSILHFGSDRRDSITAG